LISVFEIKMTAPHSVTILYFSFYAG